VTAATVPIRMRATANPGNVGHEWVKTRFVDPQTRPPGVFFLRARLEDNDYLDQLSYIGTLMHLDPITRRQLLEGDWDVVPGGTLIMPGVFGFFDAPSPAARMARAWDLAATRVTPGVADDPDWTVGTRIHRTTSDEFEIVDVVGIRDEAGAVERLVGSTAAADGRRVVIGVPRDPGQAGKQQVDHFRRRVLRGYTVYEMPTTKAKAKRAEPFAAAANNGLVSIQRADWTSFVVRQYTGFPFTGHDDHLDSAADAHQLAAGGGSVNVAAPPRRRVNPTIGR
jgi:predicted phage terminase large subunit-like protein